MTPPAAPPRRSAPPASSNPAKRASESSPAEWVLLAILLLIPTAFSRWTEDAWDFPKGALLTSGALVLAALGLATELSRAQRGGLGIWASSLGQRLGAALRRDPLGAVMLLFVLSSAASALASPNPGLGFYGAPGSYSGVLTACASATLYFTARILARNPRFFPRLCLVTGIAAAIASAYGVVQFTGQDPIPWGTIPYLRGLRRVAGTMGQPNLLGIFLVMALPLMTWTLARRTTWRGRALWGAIVLLALVALVMTFSRASWLALGVIAVVGTTLFAWTRPVPSAESAARRRRTAAIFTAGLLLVLGVSGAVVSRTPMGQHLFERVREISNLRETGNAARLESWRLGMGMVSSRLVLGVGTDQFGWEFPAHRTIAYYRLEHGAVPATAHNVAVNLLVNQGVPGLVLGALIVLLCLGAAFRALRQEDPWIHGAVVATAMALGAFLMWDLVNYTVAAVGALAAVLAGWIAGIAAQRSSEGAAKVKAPRPQSISVGAGVVATVVFLFTFMAVVVRPVLGQIAQRVALRQTVGSANQIQALQRASNLVPWDGRYQNHLAGAFLTVENSEKDAERRRAVLKLARAAVEKAIAADPRNALFHARHGWVLARMILAGEPNVTTAQVRAALETASRRDPVNRDVLDRSTETWLMLREHAEARNEALSSIELFPESARPLGYIGLIALREKRWGDAADTLSLALGRDWRGDQKLQAMAQANLSAAYIELGRYREAEAIATQALANDPDLAAARQNREFALKALAGSGALQGGP